MLAGLWERGRPSFVQAEGRGAKCPGSLEVLPAGSRKMRPKWPCWEGGRRSVGASWGFSGGKIRQQTPNIPVLSHLRPHSHAHRCLTPPTALQAVPSAEPFPCPAQGREVGASSLHTILHGGSSQPRPSPPSPRSDTQRCRARPGALLNHRQLSERSSDFVLQQRFLTQILRS